MIFDRYYIFVKFKSLINALNKNKLISDFNFYLQENYILGECFKRDDCYSIRIWKSNALFYYYIDEMDESKNLISSLDYKINKDNIKIEQLEINDDNNYFYDDIYLSLIKYIINIAEKNKKKILVYVPSNKIIYYKYYKDFGFELTDKKCNYSFWIEIEKNINNKLLHN